MQQMQRQLELVWMFSQKIFLKENAIFDDEIEYDSTLPFRNISRHGNSADFQLESSVAGCLSRKTSPTVIPFHEPMKAQSIASGPAQSMQFTTVDA